MEKILSVDERIKKAEMNYYGRHYKNNNENNTTVSVKSKNKTGYLYKFIIQLICATVLFGIINIYPQKEILGINIKLKVKEILNYEVNLNQILANIKKEKISNENTEEIKQEAIESEPLEGEQQTIEETLAVVETIATPELLEEASSSNQMQENANYIKENYSVIKPLEGQITSRYGVRNSSYANVTKYHTGIDIAENVGVSICAAMEGTVELVSTQGDLGNHIAIVNGDITTVYAHCSKMLVEEGQNVKQGEKIAEVGATGNVTGPHLHFEIKRNNVYVDPDMVIQF